MLSRADTDPVITAQGRAYRHDAGSEFVAREPRGTVNRALSAWKELTAPRPVARSGIPETGV